VLLAVAAILISVNAIIRIATSPAVEKIYAVAAAQRLGLRDRGRMGASAYGVYVHEFCKTPVRIGIDDVIEEAVRYCWRCEKDLDLEDDEPDPKNKEDLPVEEPVSNSITNDEKVVELTQFRKAS
jgi:hypothetical protein